MARRLVSMKRVTALDADGVTEKQFLAQYNPGKYPRPSLTADTVVFTAADVPDTMFAKELCVLLIRRKNHPFLGSWALPGGFVEPSETAGEAAKRELAEETGIQGGYLEQFYTFSKPGRDPRTWVVSCAHMALVNDNRLTLQAGSDADDAQWFSVSADSRPGRMRLSLSGIAAELSAVVILDNVEFNAIENHGLAFDHAEIIARAILTLRAKLEYTGLALRLMPETFTMDELRRVCEAILGKPPQADFLRRLSGLLMRTGEAAKSPGQECSPLFTRRPTAGDAARESRQLT